MKKPEIKDYVLLFSVFFCTAICAAALFFSSSRYYKAYMPVYAANEEHSGYNKKIDIADETPVLTLSKNDEVYITDAGKAFHIDRGCAGNPENIVTTTRGEAEKMGKKPCGRCLKDYNLK